jgi:hypothetical protein
MTDTLHDALANAQALVVVESPELVAQLEAPGALALAASFYAGIGWPVFPVEPGGKVPMVKDWPNRATTDPARVEAWWRGEPHANIGIPTGVAFDVLDIDAPDGFVSLAELRDVWASMGTPMPDVLAVVATGSGGRHFLVPAHPAARNGSAFAPGVDYRAAGGFVVVPPSRLTTGDRYRWLVSPKGLT